MVEINKILRAAVVVYKNLQEGGHRCLKANKPLVTEGGGDGGVEVEDVGMVVEGLAVVIVR